MISGFPHLGGNIHWEYDSYGRLVLVFGGIDLKFRLWVVSYWICFYFWMRVYTNDIIYDWWFYGQLSPSIVMFYASF